MATGLAQMGIRVVVLTETKFVDNQLIHQSKRQYIIGVDDKELRQGIMDRIIPSTIADSGATSGVGT